MVKGKFVKHQEVVKQPLHARNSFKNKILWKRLSKSLKKLTLFFLANPVPFGGQSYQK